MQGPNLLTPDGLDDAPLLDVAIPDGAPILLNPVVLTDKAVQMVKSAMEQEGLDGHGLRMGFIDDVEAILASAGGVTVYVDPFSAAHLKGTRIDYVDGLQGSGFKFENPNIQRSCGCGMSFTT